MKKLVIIQCVNTKIWGESKNVEEFVEAKKAYDSPYFQKMKEYTKKIIKPSERLIYSAEFGLITLDYKICVYNTTYNKSKTNPLSKEEMKNRIASQIINEGSHKKEFKKVSEINKNKQKKIKYADFDEIIIIGGKKYVEKIKEPLKNLNKKVQTPFQDNNLRGRGIGYIMQWLDTQINHE